MKHNRNPLYSAVHHALGASVIAGLAMTAAPVVAQDEEDTELDRIQVTGSRIVRTDIEGALPVTVIDREAIELSGKTNVADLLRNTSFNIAGSFRPQSGSTGQSAAILSLRGLGARRTLVLLDGRRLPLASNLGGGQNLNVVPLAAVERIEILSEGASAIYGTDAIAGVVNIITRKDFEGAEIMYGFSDPKRKGGDTEEGSVIMGIQGDRGRIMAGASFNQRDIVLQRDRAWSRGGASQFSNNFADLGLYTPGTFFLHPQNGSVVPGDGCTGEAFTIGSTPTGPQCHYDFTFVAADEAEIRNESIFTRATYDINDDWSLYMNASVSRLKSFGRYAPVPSSPFPPDPIFGQTLPFLPFGSPNHPATPPEEGGFNPEWESYQQVDGPIWFLHRFASLGPRDTNVDTNVYDIDLGAHGQLGDWDLQFGARQTEEKYIDLGRNYVVGAIAQQQIENGSYNIYDPFAVSPAVASSMIATINRDAGFRMREVYGSVSTNLFDMRAGPVGLAFGGEYREELFQDIFDSLSEAGQVVGSAGNSSGGDRSVRAVYAEMLFPLHDTLELTLQARYDDYSDYGSDFSPKVALRYQPLDMLTFRASWGEGFRAPELDLLTQLPTFSANAIVDEATCLALGQDPGCSAQVTNWVFGSPIVNSENSEQFGLGVAFQPTNFLSGALDYWRYEIENIIGTVGAQTVVNCLSGSPPANCPPGLVILPPGTVGPDPDAGFGLQRDPSTGAVTLIQRGAGNFGKLETDGFDLNLRTNFDFGGAGRMANNLQATYLMSRRTDGGPNAAGGVGFPRYRATLSNQYSIADFAFVWNINYIHKQSEAASPALDRTHSWTTHDLQASYHTPWNGQLTVGVQNLGDRDPPIDFGFGRGFNFNLYDGYGRVPYVRYTQRF